MTYIELMSQIEALKMQAETVRKSEIEAARVKIDAIMAECGMTRADLCGGGAGLAPVRSGSKGSRVAIKYRDPSTGSTWTGRGKRPRWLQSRLDGGATLDSFSVAP